MEQANNSTAPAVSQPAKSEAVNEQIVGKPVESVATAPVLDDKDVPIVPTQKKKIKWGETEKEVSFDEAVQLAQKAFGIEEKAKSHAQKVQQAESLLEMLNKDPKAFAKVARAAGLDPQKIATEILYEQIQLNSMTPEQRELMEFKQKEAEREAALKAEQEETQRKEIDAKTQEWQQKFEGDLQKALSDKKLPMTRLTLALAAQYVDAGLQQKKEYTVEQVLPFVMRDLQNIHQSTLGSLEGEDLLNYLGEDVSNKVAMARVNRYKKGQQGNPPVQKKDEPKKNPLAGLRGKAYWAALRRQKSEQGIEAFPGQE